MRRGAAAGGRRRVAAAAFSARAHPCLLPLLAAPPPRAPAPPPFTRVPRRQAINEYQVCAYQKGAQDAECLQRGRDYSTVCPQKWIEDWKAQASEGRNLTVGTTFM